MQACWGVRAEWDQSQCNKEPPVYEAGGFVTIKSPMVGICWMCITQP